MHKAIKIPTLRHPEQTGEFNTDSMLKKKTPPTTITLFCLPVVENRFDFVKSPLFHQGRRSLSLTDG